MLLALKRMRWIYAGLLGLAISCPAFAQSLPADTAADGAEQARHQTELQAVQDTLKQSEAQRQKIESEMAATRAEREKLNSALIESNAQVQAAEDKIHTIEVRLETMQGSEEAIRMSLESRRGVIGEVLAALQRMGRSPPPAILVRPQDMLGAVRTAMMLGAVLPELKSETEALAGDLNELIQLKASISTEKTNLDAEVSRLNEDHRRLTALMDERQAALVNAQGALDAEREREADLARQATSLKDLIARMESSSAAAAAAAAAARKADAAQASNLAALDSQNTDNQALPPPFRDHARTAPARPFSAVKAMLPLPASGRIVKPFGAADGLGGTEKGISMQTRAGASVSSPADGWVSFAGPFRSYGQLLIINAGGGYYVLLAGMEKINVQVGQFVQVGEPVAAMGDGAAKTALAGAASSVALGSSGPILYIEFRKDGGPVDPGPWWAKSDLEKVRG